MNYHDMMTCNEIILSWHIQNYEEMDETKHGSWQVITAIMEFAKIRPLAKLCATGKAGKEAVPSHGKNGFKAKSGRQEIGALKP